MTEKRKPILDVLKRRKPERVPFWLMRQAGRYLPEYLELRAKAGSFLNLVYDPAAAAEVTVQPLRRFGMDAAILFSDILVVPHALGQRVTFEAGEGPRLDAIRTREDLFRLKLSALGDIAGSVYETVRQVRDLLRKEGFDETTLIGFCGSPWTVACYMVQGGGSRDFEVVRSWALRDPEGFQALIDIVTEASCAYLSGQIEAGAEAVQLFESWASVLDAREFERWVIRPTQRICAYLNKAHPEIPVIGFPRAAGVMTLSYARETGVNAIGLDPLIEPRWAAANLKPLLPVQGNIDPARLLAGGKCLASAMDNLHDAFGNDGWIFNLGHGVIKETPVAHVSQLAEKIRGWQ